MPDTSKYQAPSKIDNNTILVKSDLLCSIAHPLTKINEMNNRSKLLRLRIRNIGCIGNDGLEVALDSIVCLVGKNNAGKSTILRAYELAQGERKFNALTDRCVWAPEGEPSEIELDIHIPKGIGNIAEEWKISEGDNLIIRSKWIWAPGAEKPERSTWDPSQNDWSLTEKAGGADNVFKSRLPKPLRIGSLQDADKTEGVLLALALDPFIQQINETQNDSKSALSKSISDMVELVDGMGKEHVAHLQKIAQEVETGFSDVFPGLNLRINVTMSRPAIKIADLLKDGSGIQVKDGDSETSLSQQGTGARRALFWSMLRVHNKLKRTEEQRQTYRKELTDSLKKAKGDNKQPIEAKLAALDEGASIPEAADDPALPGYLLLIDEPENALHPMACRAAQKHLYDLAKDPDWQVMLTTHSPYFVNPLADHTTIVRLERTTDKGSAIVTKTYVSDRISFSSDEKEQLQAVQQMDAGFSEVFFGSYPILVEGDTEHATFLAAIVELENELAEQVTIVRVRGKAIFPAFIRMFEHFKINFGIVHDIDWPYTSAGKNGMWTMNGNIYEAIKSCRVRQLTVRHRYSVPDFERFLGSQETSKNKPLEAYRNVNKEPELRKKIIKLIRELYNEGSDYGYGAINKEQTEQFLDELKTTLTKWADDNGFNQDPRLTGPLKTDS